MIKCKQVQELSTQEITLPTVSTPSKVMVVDDQPLSLLHAVDLVQYQGYRVVEVNDSRQALKIAFEEQPDVILADVVMPEINGVELTKHLKLEPHTQSIPVLLMSVTEESQLRHQALKAGAEDVVLKPLDHTVLYPKLKNLAQQKRLNEVLNQTQKVLLNLATLIKAKSGYDYQSSFQLANLVRGFAEYLELPHSDIEDLVFAAYIHDIGTVSIPDYIFHKHGALTSEEKEIIHQHCVIGEQICQPLHNRPNLLKIIRHHHEKYDGSGYPDGLTMEQIPYLAQIFQLVDIYYALTQNRQSKTTYTPSSALDILEEEVIKGWRNPKLWKQFQQFIFLQLSSLCLSV